MQSIFQLCFKWPWTTSELFRNIVNGVFSLLEGQFQVRTAFLSKLMKNGMTFSWLLTAVHLPEQLENYFGNWKIISSTGNWTTGKLIPLNFSVPLFTLRFPFLKKRKSESKNRKAKIGQWKSESENRKAKIGKHKATSEKKRWAKKAEGYKAIKVEGEKNPESRRSRENYFIWIHLLLSSSNFRFPFSCSAFRSLLRFLK